MCIAPKHLLGIFSGTFFRAGADCRPPAGKTNVLRRPTPGRSQSSQDGSNDAKICQGDDEDALRNILIGDFRVEGLKPAREPGEEGEDEPEVEAAGG